MRLAEKLRAGSIPIVVFAVLLAAPAVVGARSGNPSRDIARPLAATKAPSGAFAQVSVGGYYYDGSWNTFACALKSTTGNGSKPVCWGNPNGASGEIVKAPNVYLKQISAGGHVLCGVKADGTVACSGGYGYEPLPVTGVPRGKFAQVSSGFVFSCGIRQVTATVACWGQIDSFKNNIPTDSFTQISVGFATACGILTDGSIKCFGPDTLSTPPTGTFTSVTVGYNSACALASGGAMTCWGTGTAKIAPPGSFRQVSLEGSSDNQFVVTEFACAVIGLGPKAGKLKCWGKAAVYPPNVGEAHVPSRYFTQISVGYAAACGLTGKRTILCWGAIPH
jgi:hypothetical protein